MEKSFMIVLTILLIGFTVAYLLASMQMRKDLDDAIAKAKNCTAKEYYSVQYNFFPPIKVDNCTYQFLIGKKGWKFVK